MCNTHNYIMQSLRYSIQNIQTFTLSIIHTFITIRIKILYILLSNCIQSNNTISNIIQINYIQFSYTKYNFTQFNIIQSYRIQSIIQNIIVHNLISYNCIAYSQIVADRMIEYSIQYSISNAAIIDSIRALRYRHTARQLCLNKI